MLHSMYLCPLTSGSKFSLSGLGRQRNCNATDTEAFTCDEGRSYPRSYRTQQQQLQLSSPAGGATGPGAALTRCGGDSGTFKHVEFAGSTTAGGTGVPTSSRHSQQQRQQQQQQQRGLSSSCSISASAGGRSGGGQSSARRTLLAEEEKHLRVCSMLVPLVSQNQSNLHRLSGCGMSTNNTQEQSPTTSGDRDAGNGCDTGTARGSRGGTQLGTCGVPYWDIYEYQDFRELQHGNGHVFDAQTDPHLHREGIILDNYNRLKRSCSKFRMPMPVYHLR